MELEINFRFKKFLSICLSMVMLFSFGSCIFAAAAENNTNGKKITDYSVGDILEFGWYPQSKVEDSSVIAELNSLAGDNSTWTSYGYYSGTGSWADGQMTAGDWMRYTDVIYGSNKYRGIIFDSYRPYCTGYTSSDGTYQDDNGYNTGIVYWFLYEPIKWRVLDPTTGMVMSETILDSQAYNNYILISGADEYYWYAAYGDPNKTYYANNYAESSIRQWLNYDFYNTAFSSAQQDIIEFTALDNSACSTSYSQYNSEATSDKIYLLSWSDVLNVNYGFNVNFDEDDTARRAQGSDYAKSQGLYVYTYTGGIYISAYGNSNWHLRSAGDRSYYTCDVLGNGFVGNYFNTGDTGSGVRPAFNFNLSSYIFQSDVNDTGNGITLKITACFIGKIIEFGWYPQSKVTDGDIINELNNLAGDNSTWISYDYGSYTNGNDWMRYTDVMYNSNKYRGVIIDSYRAYYTGYTSSDDTYQDDNGYNTGTVYWFLYEPIKWRVLNPKTGIVMSETILDSQAYNNYILYSDGVYWGDSSKTYYANNYAKSSIRQWLNDDFYNTAFSSVQQDIIEYTTLDNSAYKTSVSQYNSEATYDKIYLLSHLEVCKRYYGFLSNADRQAQGSDYAKSQGLKIDSGGNSSWLLRSAGHSFDYTCGVDYDGDVAGCYYYDTDYTYYGVRPALNLNPESVIFQSDVEDTGNGAHSSHTGGTATCSTKAVCVECGLSYGKLDSTNHENIVTDNAVAATCTKTGLTEGSHCETCNVIVTAQSEIEKLVHTEEIIPKVVATCTETGLTEGKKCTVCGEVTVKQQTVAALGHDKINHAAKAATCTEKGYEAYVTCSRCDYTTYKELAALGHDYSSEWTIDKAPTATAAGSKSHHCTYCDSITDVTAIPATTNDTPNSTQNDNKNDKMDNKPNETPSIPNETPSTPNETPNTPSTSDYILGDIDGDGNATAADARLALRASVGLEKIEEGTSKFLAADVDNDNEVTAADARLILRASVGLETLGI